MYARNTKIGLKHTVVSVVNVNETLSRCSYGWTGSYGLCLSKETVHVARFANATFTYCVYGYFGMCKILVHEHINSVRINWVGKFVGKFGRKATLTEHTVACTHVHKHFQHIFTHWNFRVKYFPAATYTTKLIHIHVFRLKHHKCTTVAEQSKVLVSC